jgi:small-conductance mechanosensitive channel
MNINSTVDKPVVINKVWSINSIFNSIKTETMNFIPKLVISIIIFILFSILANIVYKFIVGHDYDFKFVKSEIVNNNKNVLIHQIANITYNVIIIFGFIFAFVNLGFDITLILSLVALFAIGFGLAIRDLIVNFIAGIYIATNNLFRIGDIIKINDVTGTVYEFTLFHTVVIDSKLNVPVIIPNTQLQNNILEIVNKT